MANCLYRGRNIPIELSLDQLLIYVKFLTYSISYYKIKINLLVVINYIFIVPIELPKFEKYKKGQALDNWVKFILNPKVINMSNKEIKKAKELLEEISKNDQERYLAELREKYIRDQKATEGAGYDKGLAAGLKQGIEKGKVQGFEKGEKTKAIEIAKKLKQKGIDIEIIKETTNLTIEEINKL